MLPEPLRVALPAGTERSGVLAAQRAVGGRPALDEGGTAATGLPRGGFADPYRQPGNFFLETKSGA